METVGTTSYLAWYAVRLGYLIIINDIYVEYADYGVCVIYGALMDVMLFDLSLEGSYANL